MKVHYIQNELSFLNMHSIFSVFYFQCIQCPLTRQCLKLNKDFCIIVLTTLYMYMYVSTTVHIFYFV